MWSQEGQQPPAWENSELLISILNPKLESRTSISANKHLLGGTGTKDNCQLLEKKKEKVKMREGTDKKQISTADTEQWKLLSSIAVDLGAPDLVKFVFCIM